jgi:alpha-maltose-1-phosphate synthase
MGWKVTRTQSVTHASAVVISHPTGNPWARSDLRALERTGCLVAFYTTVAVPRLGAQYRTLPMKLRRELARRVFTEVPASKITTSPLREVVRLAAGRLGLHSLVRHEVGWASVDAVYHALDRRLAQDLERGKINAAAVYAYEDGALETFKAARRLGMRRIYHLPIAYWRLLHGLLAEEKDRRPDWASTMIGLADSAAKHRRKDLELADADCVIVASSFTRDSLNHCPERPRRIEIVPYGAPPAVARAHLPADDRKRPLRALFVGHLSQRKGLADLHDAMTHVRGLVTLTMVGPRVTADCPAVNRVIEAHHWLPPVPHARLLELMADHDVLVFPSIVEGFGLVITEALSRGLPVITTPHTGAADLMTDGRDGFIVPIRSPDAIADRLARLAEDRDLLAAMSAAALETARRNPWERYEERIVQIVTGAEGSPTDAASPQPA